MVTRGVVSYPRKTNCGKVAPTMTSNAPVTPRMKAAFQRKPRRCAGSSSSSPGLTKRFIARVLVILAASFLGTAAADDLVTFVSDDLTVETADGQRYDFLVELALTPKQRSQGLMFRQEMAENAGMLFLFDREAPRSFWMRNTYLALDLIFIDSQGMIVAIARDAVPLDETPIPSGEPAVGVLEVLAGTAERLGLTPGDRVLYCAFSG